MQLSADMWREFALAAGAFPGVLVEDKRYSFTAHYRGAPLAAPALRAALLRVVAAHAGRRSRTARRALRL